MMQQLQGIGMTSRRTRQRLIDRLKEEGITSKEVLDVMLETPRHIFVDEALSHRAYEDTALPIGHNQTLSQPYIVARMTEILLEARPAKVLELGTGSGYQTSVLAQLVKEVYTVERIKPLQDKARKRLALLKLNNVQLKHADGGMGWPEKAPFDAIIVTAAPEQVPEDLLAQLADGGRLILPLGGEKQTLNVIERQGDRFQRQEIEPVMFVPLLAGVIR